VRIDHVVLGSADLDATSERFLYEHGLASVPGGLHAAWGTANRIVPLGDTYVEFLAVVDPVVAGSSRFGRFLARLTAEGDRWFTVCMADDDLDGTATRLGLEVVPGARVRPDGVEVRWRSAGLEDPKRDAWLPFFIEWRVAPETYPGRTHAEHPTPATGISWVELGGDPGRLVGWIGGELPSLRMTGDDDREPGVRRVGLSTPVGEIVV
jgi:glyoxalase-like protein